MKDEGIEASMSYFNTIANWMVINGDANRYGFVLLSLSLIITLSHNRALSLLDLLPSYGLSHDDVFLTTLTKAAFRIGDSKLAVQFLYQRKEAHE